nr:MAG TPA_asm: hypothetical protein [Caudoviricetes sp.]
MRKLLREENFSSQFFQKYLTMDKVYDIIIV